MVEIVKELPVQPPQFPELQQQQQRTYRELAAERGLTEHYDYMEEFIVGRDFGRLIGSIFNHMGVPAGDRDDLQQDVVEKLLRHPEYADPERKMVSFARIARNHIINRYTVLRYGIHERPAGLGKESQKDVVAGNELIRHIDITASALGALTVERRTMLDALHKLEPQHTEILWLVYYWGYTPTEATRHLGLSDAAGKGRIRRARESLRRHLGESV